MENAKERSVVDSRLKAIDVLRGSAALLVVFSHIKHHSDNPRLDWRYLLAMPLDLGELGVSLFIVISGFCIHLSVAKRMGRGEGICSDWGSFWRRRVHRLYPPYLAAIVVGVVAFYLSKPGVVPDWQQITSLRWDIFAHLLMIHNLSPLYWAGVGNFPLWTLGMEEQLYALYFLYLVLRRRLPLPRVLLVVLVVSASWIVCIKFLLPVQIGRAPLVAGQWGAWPFTFWFNWVLGAVAAEAYAGAVKLPNWCYRGYLAFWLAIFGILIGPRVLGRFGESHFLASQVGLGPLQITLDLVARLASIPIALACFLLLNSWVRLEIQGRFRFRLSSWLAKVGLFSYSLYLTHTPMLHLLESFVHLGDDLTSIFLRYVLFTPLCLASAMVFFQLIERRFLTYQLHRVSLAMLPSKNSTASTNDEPATHAPNNQ